MIIIIVVVVFLLLRNRSLYRHYIKLWIVSASIM